MRTEDIRADKVFNWLKDFLDGELHAKRIRSLSDAVLGAIKSASLAVAAMGLALADAHGLTVKHTKKQVDRTLSNEGIYVETLFTQWVRKVVGSSAKIKVAMDWTDFDADDQSTIVLSLVIGNGRAMPLIWMTVYKAELTGRMHEFEDACLYRLKEALPEGIHVTIIADRGFADIRLMEFLTTLGMDYVIRIRGNTNVTSADGETKLGAEWAGKTARPKKLAGARLTRKRFMVGAFVCVKAKGMKDAWHLVASDGTKSARQIIGIYSERWGIESNFRDTKDIHFGMGMSALHISDPRRRDRLLFVCALATMLVTILGEAGESLGMDKGLRACTAKRRTHSQFRQGLMLFQLIPNMPEIRRLPLMQRFNELIMQDGLLMAVFKLVEK
jgi:hypothetical protein